MIFKIFVDLESYIAQSDDPLVSINSISSVDGIMEIEISKPDEESMIGMT